MARDRLPTVLCYDVEDIVEPRTDDAALFMAEQLAGHGLTGSFQVVGEKARLWQARGRRDVIEAVKRHHVGYHSTWHSVHPTTSEICAGRDLAEGMAALWEWDAAGWADTERILGRPLVGWACTGNSWSPSVMGLMGRMGRAYCYGFAKLPGHDVCWYAGCPSFFVDHIGGFDSELADDAAFAARLAQVGRDLDAHVAADRRGARALGHFVCHPTRAVSTGFWDAVNFLRGANPPRAEWRSAPLLDDARWPVIRANHRRLCAQLRDDPRLEVIGWGEAIRRCDRQRARAGHAELVAIARRIVDERRVLFDDWFSAAELLLLMGRALVAPAATYPRPDALGPLAVPPPTPLGPQPAAELAGAARAVLDEAAAGGFLPASAPVGGSAAGIGWLFVAFAEALIGRDRVAGPAEAAWPREADAIAEHAALKIPDWVIHRPDLDLGRLLEQTRLQGWTLKPAWPNAAVAAADGAAS